MEVYLSYPFAKYLWDTYNGHPTCIEDFLKSVTRNFFQDLKKDESYEFDFPAYKWLIFDNEDFQGHDFQKVIDKYWFEEDCILSRFLIDHVIMVDINLENPNMDFEGFRELVSKGLDWETTPTLSNFETIQVDLPKCVEIVDLGLYSL
ncbi:11304_t:CDS:2 [Ambispora leptoticha]|uniref:11304_t:CDS:1 n=1 Tax=Ambispora leptoticha TaxID=144679 RepID=A0A9N9GSS4_9GLOM|nr:11304_t:CDS:2 [Ambispora leptoticha]